MHLLFLGFIFQRDAVPPGVLAGFVRDTITETRYGTPQVRECEKGSSERTVIVACDENFFMVAGMTNGCWYFRFAANDAIQLVKAQ